MAGGWHTVESRHCALGYLVAIDTVGWFAIAADGRVLDLVETHPEASVRHIADAAVGPPLILALALQGAYCLHASAVRLEGRTIAFLGTSGSGKSTLAAELPRVTACRCTRISDDILPVEIGNEALVALPHFPQLKLAADEQPQRQHPHRLAVDALCVLDEAPGTSGRPSTVELEPLPPQDGLVALMRHTVAARLFAPELRRAHLEACAQAVERTPLLRLAYPWRRDVFAEVAHALVQSL